MLDKVQHFLKNKHKFDRKLDSREQIEAFNLVCNRYKDAIRSENVTLIRQAMALLLVDMIKYANSKNINLSELIQSEFKINL